MKASNGRGHQINHRLTPFASRPQRYPSRIHPLKLCVGVTLGIFCSSRMCNLVVRVRGRSIKYETVVRQDVTILQRKRQVPSLGKKRDSVASGWANRIPSTRRSTFSGIVCASIFAESTGLFPRLHMIPEDKTRTRA